MSLSWLSTARLITWKIVFTGRTCSTSSIQREVNQAHGQAGSNQKSTTVGSTATLSARSSVLSIAGTATLSGLLAVPLRFAPALLATTWRFESLRADPTLRFDPGLRFDSLLPPVRLLSLRSFLLSLPFAMTPTLVGIRPPLGRSGPRRPVRRCESSSAPAFGRRDKIDAMFPDNLTRAEAKARSALIQTESYRVEIDLSDRAPADGT